MYDKSRDPFYRYNSPWKRLTRSIATGSTGGFLLVVAATLIIFAIITAVVSLLG